MPWQAVWLKKTSPFFVFIQIFIKIIAIIATIKNYTKKKAQQKQMKRTRLKKNAGGVYKIFIM